MISYTYCQEYLQTVPSVYLG
uniref:Uncharacterized protein n=1 Tax=Arundo donax TaxID=35708 RepID=A0A0A9ELK4_ARUDO